MNNPCFICLDRIPSSDDDIELKLHLFEVHSVKVHLKELVEMCAVAEERELREGWSLVLDDILEEERGRREVEARKRAESGGWMGIFCRNKRTPECLHNNTKAETNEVDCFLCQEIVKSCEYDKHLEKQHEVKFGLKEIKKAGEKNEIVPKEEPNNSNEEAERDINKTDADTVKELVEMKHLSKKRISPTERFVSRKYEVLVEKEVFVNHEICFHLGLLAGH